MLFSRFGSEDGHDLYYYHRANHYEVADTLARYFICAGYAVESKYAEFYHIHAGIGPADNHQKE